MEDSKDKMSLKNNGMSNKFNFVTLAALYDDETTETSIKANFIYKVTCGTNDEKGTSTVYWESKRRDGWFRVAHTPEEVRRKIKEALTNG
jgi:hypothetical protein